VIWLIERFLNLKKKLSQTYRKLTLLKILYSGGSQLKHAKIKID
jgi:hypothetical protein